MVLGDVPRSVELIDDRHRFELPWSGFYPIRADLLLLLPSPLPVWINARGYGESGFWGSTSLPAFQPSENSPRYLLSLDSLLEYKTSESLLT